MDFADALQQLHSDIGRGGLLGHDSPGRDCRGSDAKHKGRCYGGI